MAEKQSRAVTDAPDTSVQNYDPKETSVEQSYAIYAELQAKCPVAYNKNSGGFFMLTRYDDVLKAATDWKTFSSAQGVALPRDTSRGQLPAIEMDPPQHGPWRKLFTDAVSAEALRSVEPALRSLANSVIDKFASRGECDLVHELAEPYPVLGMCQVIGLTDKDPALIRELAHEFSSVDPAQRAGVYGRFGAFIVGELLERRVKPREDYLTRIALAEIDGRQMNEAEMIGFMTGFLVAGHESTTSALASMLFHALKSPELRARMLRDDKALAAAIEETMRLNSPFHGFTRTTMCPVEIDGVKIPEGEAVQLYYAAANRDPAAFDRPEEFDIDRPKNLHFGFGMGRHACAGAPLARLEMRIAFHELLTRLPDIQLTDDRIEWKFIGPIVSSPKSLRAHFAPT